MNFTVREQAVGNDLGNYEDMYHNKGNMNMELFVCVKIRMSIVCISGGTGTVEQERSIPNLGTQWIMKKFKKPRTYPTFYIPPCHPLLKLIPLLTLSLSPNEEPTSTQNLVPT